MMIQDLQEEIKCSICVMDFSVPVTIHCGHTFCRECLVKSPNKQCPLCRKQIVSNVERLQENITITQIIETINRMKGRNQGVQIDENEQKSVIERVYMENMQLFITNSKVLMLPYSKTKITIKSNTISLPQNIKNIILKHGSHQNPYGLLGNLTNVTPNPQFNFEYQATFIPTNFFEIQSVNMAQMGNQQHQFCKGVAIVQKNSIPLSKFSSFFKIYDNLNHQYKQLISQVIDPMVLAYRSDSVAILYVIYQLMLISDTQKMHIIKTFNDQVRTNRLQTFFQGIDIQAATRSPTTIFSFRVSGNYSSTYVFAVIFILLILWKVG